MCRPLSTSETFHPRLGVSQPSKCCKVGDFDGVSMDDSARCTLFACILRENICANCNIQENITLESPKRFVMTLIRRIDIAWLSACRITAWRQSDKNSAALAAFLLKLNHFEFIIHLINCYWVIIVKWIAALILFGCVVYQLRVGLTHSRSVLTAHAHRGPRSRRLLSPLFRENPKHCQALKWNQIPIM